MADACYNLSYLCAGKPSQQSSSREMIKFTSSIASSSSLASADLQRTPSMSEACTFILAIALSLCCAVMHEGKGIHRGDVSQVASSIPHFGDKQSACVTVHCPSCTWRLPRLCVHIRVRVNRRLTSWEEVRISTTLNQVSTKTRRYYKLAQVDDSYPPKLNIASRCSICRVLQFCNITYLSLANSKPPSQAFVPQNRFSSPCNQFAFDLLATWCSILIS